MLTDVSSLLVKVRSRLARHARKRRDQTFCGVCAKSGTIVNVGRNVISDLRLLGVSKMGHLSWAGCLANRPVKIYQTVSPAHADYIERVSKDSVLGRYFPRVICRWEEYLVVEWIEGIAPRLSKGVKGENLIEEIAEMQAALHSHTLPAEPESFDYATYLQNRLRHYLGPFAQSETICQLLNTVQHYVANPVSVRVSHPDITPTNLVIENATGRLKVIDNEMLTQSWYYLIDLFNTYATLVDSEDLADQYINLYWKAGGDIATLLEHRRFFLALWSLRIISSALQAGDLCKALGLEEHLHRDHLAGQTLIHVVEGILK